MAVMLYVRFPLSLRNVEDLLHERGVDAGITRFATVAKYNVRTWLLQRALMRCTVVACHTVERPEGVCTSRSVRNLARALAGEFANRNCTRFHSTAGDNQIDLN